MANYLCLPVELRQDILLRAVQKASEGDTVALLRVSINNLRPSEHKTRLQAKVPGSDDARQKYQELSIRLFQHAQHQDDPSSSVLSREAMHALAYFPIVHNLTRILRAAHPKIGVDLIWVIERWSKHWTAARIRTRITLMEDSSLLPKQEIDT